MTNPQRLTPDLAALVDLFYPSAEELARFDEVSAERMSADHRTLLAHNNHMTVTIESFHGSLVDVNVRRENIAENHYAREILLTRQSDGAVVQYGIMRVDFAHLDQPVREKIHERRLPLGRILITHNVLRQVELQSLWQITPAEPLARMLDMSAHQTTHGRTALIYCDGEPAIELLEIVTPVSFFQ